MAHFASASVRTVVERPVRQRHQRRQLTRRPHAPPAHALAPQRRGIALVRHEPERLGVPGHPDLEALALARELVERHGEESGIELRDGSPRGDRPG